MKKLGLAFVALVIAFGIWVMVQAGGVDCGELIADVERPVGSLNLFPLPNSSHTDVERLRLYRCSDGTVKADVVRFDVQLKRR